MAIEWRKDKKNPNPRITPSLKFDQYDGYHDCTIYYDHIPVAYFGQSGEIIPLPLECGPFRNGGEDKDVQYLRDHGVELEEVEKSIFKDDPAFTSYAIKCSRGDE